MEALLIAKVGVLQSDRAREPGKTAAFHTGLAWLRCEIIAAARHGISFAVKGIDRACAETRF